MGKNYLGGKEGSVLTFMGADARFHNETTGKLKN